MKITREEVERIAHLASLELSDDEKAKFATQLDQIVEYVHKLNEIDTTGVEPLAHVNDLINVYRKDVSRPSHDRAEVLKNAPESDGEFFLVPKVINTDTR